MKKSFIKIVNIYRHVNCRYPLILKLARYIMSGGTGAAVDLGLLYLFTDILMVWYLMSSILAFLISYAVSFMMQKYWTFGDMSRDRIEMQVVAYLSVALINLCLNTLLMYAFVDLMHLHYMVSQFMTSILIAIESFLIYRLIFRDTNKIGENGDIRK